jgi:hypothetical protein
MSNGMHIVQDVLVGLLLFTAGAVATLWTSFVQDTSPFVDAVLGPLGALALAMLVIYGLIRYLNSERREARDANEARIKLLQEENARLWQRISEMERR